MDAGEGPRRTASSASFTWRESSSQSEYPTTARIPSSRHGRIARQAISPRLAMNILRKGASATLLDILPRQDRQGLAVLRRGLRDHVAGEFRARSGLVPRKRQEVVADELLVEALLRAPGPVVGGGPEARGIRRQGFVDENQPPLGHAELELGVRDDDA